MEKSLMLAKSLLQTLFFSFRMNKNVASFFALIALVTLFNGLIPLNGNVGLNYFMMSIASLGLAIMIHQPPINNRLFWWVSLGAIASGLNVAYELDSWSILMYYISHFLVIGALHSKNVQNLFVALFQWIILSITQLFYFIRFLLHTENWPSIPKSVELKKTVKILILPALLCIAFITLYSQASSNFNSLISVPLLKFFDYVSSIADGKTIFSSIVACFFLIPLLIPVTIDSLRLKFKKQNRFLARKIKKEGEKVNVIFPTMGLKHELQIATKTMLTLNILVLIFNALDIMNVWFDQSSRTAAELSEYVHNGTNVTIVSILLGTLIITVFFRGNLNFISGNHKLKTLASIWLAQNVFLVASTFIRNYRYVDAYGLTEKRMGVMIFLAMTLIGILFTYQKIHQKHQILHLFNRFCLSAYLVVLVYSVIDHPAVIIHYAANYQTEIDESYITRLAWKRDALLDRHKEKLNEKMSHNKFIEVDQHMFQKRRNPSWLQTTLVEHRNDKLGRRIRLRDRY